MDLKFRCKWLCMTLSLNYIQSSRVEFTENLAPVVSDMTFRILNQLWWCWMSVKLTLLIRLYNFDCRKSNQHHVWLSTAKKVIVEKWLQKLQQSVIECQLFLQTTQLQQLQGYVRRRTVRASKFPSPIQSQSIKILELDDIHSRTLWLQIQTRKWDPWTLVKRKSK